MDKLKKDIKDKNFENVYLIYGKEAYLKNQYEKNLIDAIVDDNFKMMNFAIFEGRNISIPSVIDTCNTLPFMAEHRLVVVKDSDIAFDRKEDIEMLDNYIQNMTKSTVLLFVEERIDKRNKIYKSISSNGYICEIEPFKEDKLIKWIIKYLKSKNKFMEDKTALYFVRNINQDMENIVNELEKLIAYQHKEEITIQDIDNICSKSTESKVFNLIKLIGRKDSKGAIAVYNMLIANKTSPFLILSMIARQLKIILKVKYLARTSSIGQIAKELALKDFIVKEAIEQGRNFKNLVLIEAINDCLEVDRSIKTGKMEDRLAVELFIIKYTTCKN